MTTEPWLCLVTDRRRLTAAAGQEAGEWQAVLLEQIEGAVRAGVTLVQIRERDLAARPLLDLVRAAVRLAAGSSTRIVVNDRLDVALASKAGIHLRGDSPSSLNLAALIGPDLLVGRSVHGCGDVSRERRADYLVASTVFPTPSKTDKDTWLGTSGLADIVHAAGRVPVLAIGGITAATCARIVASGVVGVASIGAFLPQGPGESVATAVARRADTLRRVFTTAGADL